MERVNTCMISSLLDNSLTIEHLKFLITFPTSIRFINSKLLNLIFFQRGKGSPQEEVLML